MVPMPETVIQLRLRNLAAHNNGDGRMFFSERRPQPPRITYGKQDGRPLSLTANQFRRDIFALSSQHEDGATPREPAGLADRVADPHDSEDSELSDAEPLPSRNSRQSSSLFKVRVSDDVSDAGTINAQARSLSSSPENHETKTAQPRQPPNRNERQPLRLSSVTKPVVKDPRSKTPKQKQITAPRRLPVNELFLVGSPVDYTKLDDPKSSHHGMQSNDPINDLTSSPRKRGVSVSSNEEDTHQPSKKSLSTIRNQLRTPDARHKSLASLRKSYKWETTFGSQRNTEPKGRDGFEESELAIPPFAKVRRQSRRKDPLTLGFGSLQLQSGPLPEVEFNYSTAELKMEDQSAKRGETPLGPVDNHNFLGGFSDHSQRVVWRVSFNERAQREAIMAELSSISAPARVHCDSEDGDIDEDDEDEEVDDEDVQQLDQGNADDGVPHDDREGRPGISSSSKPPQLARRQIEQPESLDTGFDRRRSGVTLDFRRPAAASQNLGHSFGRRTLMEVNEAIVEVPDSDLLQEAYTFADYRTARRDPEIDQILNSRPTRQEQQQQHRPRSILKNSTQMVPDSTTRQEATDANTRRNSTVDLTESRYFTDASNMLRPPDPASHRIVPRRRSSYFDRNADIEIVDSEHLVPETSPELPDYTNASNLHVLRRNTEAVWSSNVPVTPRDLKSLTRSVSREHGT